MTLRNTLGFLVLLALAGGTFYLAQSLEDPQAEPEDVPSVESGFYLRATRILGTGADGRLLYEVVADYAEQQPNRMIEFENVRIVYMQESGVPWTLNADTALIGDDQELLILRGHVVAVGSEGLNGEVTEIRTPYLELRPELYRAETDDRVQVRIGTRSLTATGMLASLQDNEFQLKSNVSGKFVP